MKKRNCAVGLQQRGRPVLRDTEESLEVSVSSHQDEDTHIPSGLKSRKPREVQSCVKSKYLNSVSTDTMFRRGIPSIFIEEENYPSNMDSGIAGELRSAVHLLQKKDASNRLEISKLKKEVSALKKENQRLGQEIKVQQNKMGKDSEYILRLDAQLRLYKDEMVRSGKSKGSVVFLKVTRLEKENQEMKFVIEELLEEIDHLKEERETEIETEMCTMNQNQEDVIQNLRTYPDSQSERSQSMNSWEITMNPHGNRHDQRYDTDYGRGRQLTPIQEDLSRGQSSEFVEEREVERTYKNTLNSYSRSRFTYEG